MFLLLTLKSYVAKYESNLCSDILHSTAQIYVNRKTHIKCTKITCKCKFKKGGASKKHTCALKLDFTASLVMKLRPEKKFRPE